jgi:hypothetical protein
MAKENGYLNELYDHILDLMVNQKVLTEHGGRSHVDLDDLESQFYDEEYVKMIGDMDRTLDDMEFQLCRILRKRYLRKHPELVKLARGIAKKIVLKEEENY